MFVKVGWGIYFMPKGLSGEENGKSTHLQYISLLQLP